MKSMFAILSLVLFSVVAHADPGPGMLSPYSNDNPAPISPATWFRNADKKIAMKDTGKVVTLGGKTYRQYSMTYSGYVLVQGCPTTDDIDLCPMALPQPLPVAAVQVKGYPDYIGVPARFLVDANEQIYANLGQAVRPIGSLGHKALGGEYFKGAEKYSFYLSSTYNFTGNYHHELTMDDFKKSLPVVIDVGAW